MASQNAVLKSGSKSKLIQVSTSAQTQQFSSMELLLDSYMPEMALSGKFRNVTARCGGQILIIVTKSSRLVIDRIED